MRIYIEPKYYFHSNLVYNANREDYKLTYTPIDETCSLEITVRLPKKPKLTACQSIHTIAIDTSEDICQIIDNYGEVIHEIDLGTHSISILDTKLGKTLSTQYDGYDDCAKVYIPTDFVVEMDGIMCKCVADEPAGLCLGCALCKKNCGGICCDHENREDGISVYFEEVKNNES